jgi:hypothetical protein
VASAAQDAAITQLAAIEPEAREDGTWGESHRALGHMALDAPAVVSGVLKVSAGWAERRVRTAVSLAADGPVGTDTETGLGGLHEAMAAGRLDGYRASVLAEELAEAPPEVAATVVAALDAYVETEDAGQLRRRCRRALARISPDLLRQRAQRARANAGLRRWAEEPGVDRWEGTFPSEEAAMAWAAIDALAQRYVAEAVCATIERARAKALTDLVAGNATVETVVTLTVPAATLPELAPTTGSGAAPLSAPEPGAGDEPGARSLPGAGTEPGVGTEPGAGAEPGGGSEPATGSRVPGDDLVEVGGLRAGDPLLAPQAWVSAAARNPRTVLQLAPCHPVTGALVDVTTADGGPTDSNGAPPDMAGTDPPTPPVRPGGDGYRPSARLARLVRVRDRSCRFPGCTIAAVFCDIDHVHPWPTGPTSAENLMCLCRRHHRVKQRPGWRVVLAADGTATWTDPTGRLRTTAPVDALTSTILRGAAGIPQVPHSTSRTRTVLADGPHSELEFHLEHLGADGDESCGTGRDRRNRPARRGGHRAGRGPGKSGARHVHLAPPVAAIRIPELPFLPHQGAARGRWRRISSHAEHGGDADLPPF